jgi:hypothetical protein
MPDQVGTITCLEPIKEVGFSLSCFRRYHKAAEACYICMCGRAKETALRKSLPPAGFSIRQPVTSDYFL